MDIRATLRLCKQPMCTFMARHWGLHVNGVRIALFWAETQGEALDRARVYLSGDQPRQLP